MIAYLRKWWRRPQAAPVPVEVPARYGVRPDLSELKAALEKQGGSEQVRAFVHLLLMARTRASYAARAAARVDKPAAFDLGGIDYLDALFSDLDGLINGEEAPDVLKQWFDHGQE